MSTDILDLVNACDSEWHGQPRSFEREAVTRFWGLLTLPARALDPVLPRKLLATATVLRNARFTGRAVQEMFFEDQHFTEVDALFFGVGSSLGHPRGLDAWIVEVERKQGHHQGDYFRAMHRARQFAALFLQRFGIQARPVVIYEDDGGKLTYKTFDGDVLLITMSTLRDRTRGLSFTSPHDIPGAACDRTLVKLALLRQLVTKDPNVPGGFGTPAALARAAHLDGWPVRLPVLGHQQVDQLPSTLAGWFEQGCEGDKHLSDRVAKYVEELVEAGLLESAFPDPRLTYDGGQAVLRALRAEDQERR